MAPQFSTGSQQLNAGSTRNRRLALAYRIYLFIRLIYVIIQAEIQLKETNRRRRVEFISTSNQQQDKALDDILLVQSLLNHRWWVAPRSHGWCQMVLNGETLQEEEFTLNFRITRNSFNHLHALLGTFNPVFLR